MYGDDIVNDIESTKTQKKCLTKMIGQNFIRDMNHSHLQFIYILYGSYTTLCYDNMHQ